MSYLLLGVVLLLACGVALFLLRRLGETQERLAALHQDLRRNELRLELEMNKAKELKENERDQSTQGEQNVEQQ